MHRIKKNYSFSNFGEILSIHEAPMFHKTIVWNSYWNGTSSPDGMDTIS